METLSLNQWHRPVMTLEIPVEPLSAEPTGFAKASYSAALNEHHDHDDLVIVDDGDVEVGRLDQTQVPMLQLLQHTMQMDGLSVESVGPSNDHLSVESREAAASLNTLERIVPSDEFDTLDEKLQFAFDLPQVEDFKDQFACWLCRSVLLRGFLFLTEYAHPTILFNLCAINLTVNTFAFGLLLEERMTECQSHLS